LRKARPAPDAIDGLVPGRLDDPRAGDVGDAGGRPLLDGGGERVLGGLLGEVELADEPDQGGDDPAPIRAIDGVDRRGGVQRVRHER
jgi:hypothetical protein